MYHARKGTNHHITGKFTCLISCHPRFLCADLNDDAWAWESVWILSHIPCLVLQGDKKNCFLQS
jgi:hypothetical protein